MTKFSVVITHYNQMNYIEEAIKSVCNQNYKSVELIVADDCSKDFKKNIVKNMIKKYNKHNFEYKIYSGVTNLGTVKNLNNALELATGEFILFFAADDRLSNKNVLKNFYREFKDCTKNIITAQCNLYDNKLKKLETKYVNIKKALNLNSMSSLKQFEKMAEGCFYGSGGTAYRKLVFEKYGKFNEKYKYVEDWAYWLYVLRNGEKIYFSNFDALDHRDGGISHSVYTQDTIPSHVKQYYKDILNIYENEVLLYMQSFTIPEQYRILKQQNETILYYSCFVPELQKYLQNFDKARLANKKIEWYWRMHTIKHLFFEILNPHIIYKIKILFKYNRVVPITFIIWFLISLLLSLKLSMNSILFLLFIISLYIIIYYIVYCMDKLIYQLLKILKLKGVKKNV